MSNNNKIKNSYKGNPLLKKPNIDVQFTIDQLREYAMCARDPIYFIKKYVRIISLDKGLIPFDMYPFQEKIIDAVHNNRFVVARLPRQQGKCVYINTIVRIRNKKTGEIKELTIGELYGLIKSENKIVYALPKPIPIQEEVCKILFTPLSTDEPKK